MDWMALTDVEVDDLLRQPYTMAHVEHGEGWYAASATPSPQMGSMGCDSVDLGAGDWSQGSGSSLSSGSNTTITWLSPPPTTATSRGFSSGFDTAGYPPPPPMDISGGYDHSHYSRAELADAGVATGYGYDTLGVYHGGCQPLGSGEVVYDAGSGLMVQRGVGSWQGGYGSGW